MGSGKGSKSKMRVTEYFCSVHYGICQGPVDSLNRIKINNKDAWSGSLGRAAVFSIDNKGLFGGTKKEGGVAGNVVWQNGTMSQFASETFAAKVGRTRNNTPAYRGIANALFTGPPSLRGEDAPPDDPLDAGNESFLPFLNFVRAIFSSGGDSKIGKKNGFYWSSNQPYIWPTHFHVTRIPRGWYGEKAQIIETENTPRAVYFAIDNSGSMNAQRRATVKSAFATIFDQFRAQITDFGMNLTLGINIWGATRETDEWTAATVADIDAAENFVNTRLDGRAGGTRYDEAAEGAMEFFTGTLGTTYDRRLMFFITDGEASDDSHNLARTIMNDLLDRTTGQFTTAAGTDVDCYAVNIHLTDTGQSDYLDNTTGQDKSITTNGQVPVVPADDPQLLSEVVREALGSGLYPSANPAHMIRECLVNTAWGAGASPSALEDSTFRAAADTLFAENFGLSMIWTQQQAVQSFVQEILDHIEGTLFVNPSTGKFELKLIRDDYDPETLEVYDETNCTVNSFQRRSPAEIINEINLTWTNPETEEEEVITGQDLGGVVINNGEIISDNRNYYGVRSRNLAATLLARDLAAVTAPLATAEIEVNRKAWKLTPGAVLRFSSDDYDAKSLLMRVVKVNYGRPGDSTVLVSLTQDIFSFARPTVTLPPDTLDENEQKYPTPFEYVRFLSLNYFLAANMIPPGVASGASYPDSFLAILASTENTDAKEFELATEESDPAGNTEMALAGTRDLTARGLLAEDFPQEAVTTTAAFTSLTRGNGPTVGGFGLIGPEGADEEDLELVLFVSNDGTNWTIHRGVLDTVPLDWPAGTPIRFFTVNMAITDDDVNPAFTPADFKLLMQTSRGIYDLQAAPIRTYSPVDRVYLPTRPANFRVGGVAFGEADMRGVDPIPVTWNQRNRIVEDSQVLSWTDGGVTEEEGQTTSLVLTDPSTGDEINRIDGLTGASYSLPVSAFNGYSQANVTAIAVRDGLDSFTGHTIRVLVSAGYGFNYGYNYGGVA